MHNPDAVYEHHALRIAAKKLRYTLETYAPLYRRGFTKPIARIKKVQDLLGDIHDCDVWIEQMTLAIIKQHTRRHPAGNPSRRRDICGGPAPAAACQPRAAPGPALPAVCPVPGIPLSAPDSGTPCGLRHWKARKRHMATATHSMRQKRNARHSCGFLLTAPDHVTHSMNVAALSLRLFDELAPLHGLGRRDRDLLSYAATVHDIGWTFGQAGHQKKSAELILMSGDLPVPVREQGIISLVAGLHGGSARVRPTGFWLLLSPSDKKRVRSLAALLRVADGLDYLHTGNVTDLHCTTEEPEVRCILTGTGDVSTEKARALKKSDLFAEVFGKTLVIRMRVKNNRSNRARCHIYRYRDKLRSDARCQVQSQPLLFSILTRQKQQVRLGEGEFDDEEITHEAIDRTCLVCRKFVDLARTFSTEEFVAVATSAAREAANQYELLARLQRDALLDVRVISGLEEARLIYLGVASGLHLWRPPGVLY